MYRHCKDCGALTAWNSYFNHFECNSCGWTSIRGANVDIDKFSGEYQFLSNFLECTVEYEGLVYRNSEAAFQAAKNLDPMVRQMFVNLNGAQAKRLGKQVRLRPDWEQVKDNVMYEVLKNKFSTDDQNLKSRLLATGDQNLIEGNTWGDRYWGVCNGQGQNKLGQILMRIREELRSVQ